MARIKLSKGGYALCDDELLPFLSRYTWSSTNGYVQAWVCGRPMYMHRLILNAGKGKEVDHKNGKRHDNRRENLRFIDHSRNCHRAAYKPGRSGLRGVTWNSGKWQAQIFVNGERHYLGRYADKVEAANVYDATAVRFFGADAVTNFR